MRIISLRIGLTVVGREIKFVAVKRNKNSECFDFKNLSFVNLPMLKRNDKLICLIVQTSKK